MDVMPFSLSCEMQLGASAAFYVALIAVETISAKSAPADSSN